MSTAVKSAGLISAPELPRIVDSAIKAAGLRTASTGPLVLRWDLAGKVARNLAEAEHFADAVSHHINASGFAVTPAVLSLDKQILAGFIERAAIPQVRQF